MRVLGEAQAVRIGEELLFCQRQDGSLELIRCGPRRRRMASLGIDPHELADLIAALQGAAVTLALDDQGAVAGTRTAGPPTFDVDDELIDCGGAACNPDG